MECKRCIFHVPYYINLDWPSGTNIRPIKLIEAFKNIGYDVEVISGYGEERKKKILDIKDKINSGIKYEFLYTESSTEPTLLTEKNHIPKYLTLDFSFWKFCKARNIKIGLFYRDIYWAFDEYSKSVGFLKSNIAKIFYKYDLIKYNKLVDMLYLPSIKMKEYIPIDIKTKVKMLPPGINKIVENSTNTHEELNIFYVGAITGLYNLEKLFKVVNDIEGIKLTVCCREKEWEDNRYIYEKYLHKNINIVHGSGDDIERYYLQADVLSLFFQPSEYRKFAMPIKLFEYIGYGKPMIATKGTATGEFVEKYDIGWNIEYSEEALFDLLLDVLRNKKLKEKSQNIKNIIPLNTWEERCKVIIEDLS